MKSYRFLKETEKIDNKNQKLSNNFNLGKKACFQDGSLTSGHQNLSEA